MCNCIYNPRLVPLNKKHLEDIKEIYPNQSEYAEKLFNVLTKNLCPQVNLFVSFVILKNMYDEGLSGIFSNFGKVLYAPLSIVAKTDEHQWTRFRPGVVDELHTSFLSFMMAKPNRISLNNLLNSYGLCFSQGHCCGILFGEKSDVDSYEKSDLFKGRNEMRSYAESMAMPVESVEFKDIPMVTSDLGLTERDFYKRYESTFQKMSFQSRENFVDSNKDFLWESIISKMVNPAISLKCKILNK